MAIRSDAERLALLEYKDTIRDTQLTEINRKLDELMALRQKGMGIFWFASIFGTGLLTLISNYFLRG